ncbi:transposase [Nocardioides sp. Soil774]|nr:transposase [Acinetobacter sp. Root1280]KRE97563.1 transposase [Nocardioides sp. Soil774]
MAARRVFPQQVRREFWGLVREGLTVAEAAQKVGASRFAGMDWYRERGGVMPRLPEPATTRPRLTVEQREEIALLHAAKVSKAEIARVIGCHRATVGRELVRGSTVFPDRLPRYRAVTAQLAADHRARRVRGGKLVANPRLHEKVQDLLEDELSPEQISAQLKIDFPDDAEMRVSHETIYRALYVQGRGELRRDLHKRLRTGRAVRKVRRVEGERRGRIPGMVNISERPAEVADRAVPGHWEGDLIMGSTASNSAIGTLVERATRFVMLLHLPEGHGADAVAAAMVDTMSRLPETLRRTLTWDQGHEMTSHPAIAAATGLDIYFCDPHSPWQRGTNENTNGLLRQYFPKSTDLSVYQLDYLDHVAAKLNRRPRKTLGWRTPAQALDELLSNPPKPTGVASTA